MKFLTDRYVSSVHLDISPSEIRNIKSRHALKVAMTQSNLTISQKKRRESHVDVERFKSLTPKMMDAVMLIIRPSTKSLNNELNPWMSESVQWRNYIMIRLLDHYGLRAGELLLLSLDSIKPNLNGGYSMVVTAPLEKDPRKATNLSIKNEHSHRTLALSAHDYKFIHHYINHHRGSPSHRFIFTSTWNNKTPLSYAMLRRAVINLFCQLERLYPDAVSSEFVESIEKLTPHMFRHTWATRKLSFLIESYKEETPNRPLRDIQLQSMDMLRSLGGWSLHSNMPALYAKRFIHDSANTLNLRRIEIEAENFAKSILENIV